MDTPRLPRSPEYLDPARFETAAILKKLVGANRQLAELNGVAATRSVARRTSGYVLILRRPSRFSPRQDRPGQAHGPRGMGFATPIPLTPLVPERFGPAEAGLRSHGMNTEQQLRPSELPVMLERIQCLAEWAQGANTYIDEHNALPPDGIDDIAREELVADMEELGGLMQRYADSLRGFADRELYGRSSATQNDRVAGSVSATVLQFPPARNRAAPMSSGGGDRALPSA